MNTEINTDKHYSRVNFKNIYMPVRIVRDREIGTFNLGSFSNIQS